MKRKYNEHDLEQAIRRTAPGDPPRPDFAQWREKHPEALQAGKDSLGAKADHDRPIVAVIKFGRNVMRRKKVRFGAIAAAVVIAVIFFGSGTDKAWTDAYAAVLKDVEQREEYKPTNEDMFDPTATTEGKGEKTKMDDIMAAIAKKAP